MKVLEGKRSASESRDAETLPVHAEQGASGGTPQNNLVLEPAGWSQDFVN